LRFSNPLVTDDAGDANISPGERATIQVSLQDVSGVGFNAYPNVTFVADRSDISPTPSLVQSYAILPCQSLSATTQAGVPASLSVGTVVNITAKAGMLNGDCQDAPTTTIQLTVR
jgi:hypothetical protein